MPNPGLRCGACLTGGDEVASPEVKIGAVTSEGAVVALRTSFNALSEEGEWRKTIVSELRRELKESLKKELLEEGELKESLKKELLKELPNEQAVTESVVAQLMQDLPRLIGESKNIDTDEIEKETSNTKAEIKSEDPPTKFLMGKKQGTSLLGRAGTSNLVVDVEGPRRESVGELCKEKKGGDGEPILDAIANELGAQDWVYMWSETMWDAIPFVGLNVMPCMDEVFVVIIAYINLAIQAAFIGLVGSNMTSSLFHDDEIVNTLTDWRVSYAHNPDFADKFTSTPLGKDICSQSSLLMQGATQAGLYNEVIEYIQQYLGMPAGACLSVLSIFLWILTCSKEMMRICLFFVGMWTPNERGSSNSIQRSHVVVQERSVLWVYGEPMQKNYQVFFTRSRIWTTTALVILPRLIILLTLGYVGVQFLVATTELDELILNCVALEVVLNVDELLFITFVPDSAARMVRKTKPLRVPKLRGIQARIVPWLKFAIIAIIMVCMCVFSLLPLINTMTDVEKVMCGGNVDFLAREMVFGTVVSGVPTISGIDTQRSSYRYQAIYERTGLSESSSTSALALSVEGGIFAFTEVQTLDAWRDRTIEDWANAGPAEQVYMGCYDEDWARNYATEYRHAVFSGVSGLLGIEVVSSCQQLKAWCFGDVAGLGGQSVRLLCPETCGGSDPLSGLLFARPRDGNPQVCEAPYVVNLAQMECADAPASELTNVSHPLGEAWQSYQQSFHSIMLSRFSTPDADGAEALTAAVSGMLAGMNIHGCNFFSPQGPNKATGGKIPLSAGYFLDFCDVQDPLLQGTRSIRPFCPQTCQCHTAVKEQYLALKEDWNSRTAVESQCPEACWSNPVP